MKRNYTDREASDRSMRAKAKNARNLSREEKQDLDGALARFAPEVRSTIGLVKI